MRYIIALDIGTTHCKAIIVDEHVRVVENFKLPIASIQEEEGQFEQDVELIFKSVLQLLKLSFSRVNGNDITCVSFSAAMHSILCVDEDGTPLSNAIIWADTRSKVYAHRLKGTIEGENIYRQTGTPIHAMSPLCKIIWIRHTKPELFGKTYKFISIKEYIFWKLFGKHIVDEGIASATGLYDIYNSCWLAESLEVAGIAEIQLSKIVEVTHIEKILLPGIKKLLQLENEIPFVAGGNDGCLANLGCGALQKNEVALTIGTSGAVRLTVPKSKPNAANGLFRYVLLKDTCVTGGPINNGGLALEWFSENFLATKIHTIESFGKVMEIAKMASPCSGGIVFLPYLTGERAPVWDEEAFGIFYGLKINHHKEQLTRAVIEGISFSLLQILQTIEQTNKNINKVYVTGIVTKSDWWMQLLADMFGKLIIVNEVSDASAMGAAFMGMYATGIIHDLAEVKHFLSFEKEFIPDTEVYELYKKHFKIYISLYQKLKPDDYKN